MTMFKLKVKGVNKVCSMLTKFSNQLDIIANEIITKLAQLGYSIANYKFSNAEYDGTNDVEVNWFNLNTLKVQLMAWGKSALFIEFGAGVSKYNGYPNRPTNIFGIGGYGDGHGKQQWWIFQNSKLKGKQTPQLTPVIKNGKVREDTYWTQGNQPARAMYSAEITIRNQIKNVAMEVVSKYVRH